MIEDKILSRFDKKLLKNLRKKMSIESCLPIQETILPVLLESIERARMRGFHRDMLVAAPTGSGKTLCYLLPIVDFLMNHSIVSNLKCLIVAPSKDLCVQITDVLRHLTAGTSIRYATIYGANDKGFGNEHDILRNESADIVVTTPVRLVDHLNLAQRNQLNFLSHLRFFVVDEADKVVQDEKFKMLVRRVLHLRTSVPQLAVDSATTNAAADGADENSSTPTPHTLHVNNVAHNHHLLADDYYGARENDFLMKMLFSATLTDDPTLRSIFNLKYPFYYQLEVPSKTTIVNDNNNNDNNNSIDNNNDNDKSKSSTKKRKQKDEIEKSSNKKRLKNDKEKSKTENSSESSSSDDSSSSNSSSDSSSSDSSSSDSSSSSASSASSSSSSSSSSQSLMKTDVILPTSFPPQLTHQYMISNATDKTIYLFTALKQFEFQKILVFANSVDVVTKLCHVLQQLEVIWNRKNRNNTNIVNPPLTVLEYSSALTVKQRSRALRAFSAPIEQPSTSKASKKSKKSAVQAATRLVMVASDSFARGFDVSDVDLVVHYELPHEKTTFVHRAGRTARAGAEGTSLALLHKKQVFHFLNETIGDKKRAKQRRLTANDKSIFGHVKPMFLKILQNEK